jgi:hypothetical protein
MCLITRGDSTVDVIAMGRRGDEDMQIFRHGEFVYPWLEWRAHDVTVTRERQSTAEGRIALGSKKRPPLMEVALSREKEGKGGRKGGKKKEKKAKKAKCFYKECM